MDSATGFLTQSKFYSPVFNAAIFDGPIKIYFSQVQESQALKLYFELQRKINKEGIDLNKSYSNNVFVMLYPNSESFYNSFDKSHVSENSNMDVVVEDKLGDDHVVGVRGPATDSSLETVYSKISDIFEYSMPNFLEEGVEALA